MTEGGVIGGVGGSGTVLVADPDRVNASAGCHVLLAAQAGEESFW